MKAMMILVSLAIISAMVLSACAVFDRGDHGLSVGELRERLSKELSPGDSRARVEEVLANLGVEYVYDSLSDRFEGRVANSERSEGGGVRSVIKVRVYMDKDKMFSKFEVEKILKYL